MAAGYRSYAFRWLGGLSAPVDTPSELCPCPEYSRDGTLFNSWKTDVLSNRPSLPYTIPIFRLYAYTPVMNSYSTPATLTSGWVRKACG